MAQVASKACFLTNVKLYFFRKNVNPFVKLNRLAIHSWRSISAIHELLFLDLTGLGEVWGWCGWQSTDDHLCCPPEPTEGSVWGNLFNWYHKIYDHSAVVSLKWHSHRELFRTWPLLALLIAILPFPVWWMFKFKGWWWPTRIVLLRAKLCHCERNRIVFLMYNCSIVHRNCNNWLFSENKFPVVPRDMAIRAYIYIIRSDAQIFTICRFLGSFKYILDSNIF